ncbi:hypothetical protein H1Q63_29800 [Desmonostoc muscorum CCALA 125]|nr:hypothetical protein [Desmonostoc muscorum CCALA 125]
MSKALALDFNKAEFRNHAGVVHLSLGTPVTPISRCCWAMGMAALVQVFIE